MDSITQTCTRIFRQLATSAAGRRDTDQEYERFRSQVRETSRGMQRRAGHDAGDRATRTAVK